MPRKMVFIGFGIALVLLLFVLAITIVISQNSKGVATLLKESGMVLVKKSNTENYSPVTADETILESGASVKTEEGLAHILFKNGSRMSLDKNTEAQIMVDTDNIAIIQTLGNTWHRVEKLLGKEYKVETPTTVATVRGTEFAVEVAPEPEAPTTVYVTENTVEVGELVQAEGRKIALNVQPVTEGNMAHVARISDMATGQSKPSVDIGQTSEEKQSSKWFARNKTIRKSFEKRKKPKEIIKTIREDTELHTIDQKPDPTPDVLGQQTGKLDLNAIAKYLAATQHDETLCRELTQAKQEALLIELTHAQKSNSLPEELVTKLRTLILATMRACSDKAITPEEYGLLRPLVTGVLRDITPAQR